MTYAELTLEQKSRLNETVNLLRGALVAARAFIGNAKYASLDASLASNAILADLSPTELLPNMSGYAGATPVMAAEVTALLTTVTNLIAVWDTPEMQALHVKFVGAVNLYGTGR